VTALSPARRVGPPPDVLGALRVEKQQVDACVSPSGQIVARIGELPPDADAGPVEVLRDTRPFLNVHAGHVAAGVPGRVGQPDRRIPVGRTDLDDLSGVGHPQHHRQQFCRSGARGFVADAVTMNVGGVA
jgi:hypothetical protein